MKKLLPGAVCTISFVLFSHAQATSIIDIPNLLMIEVCEHWSNPGSFQCTGLSLDELRANPDAFLELPGPFNGQIQGVLTDRYGIKTGDDEYFLLRMGNYSWNLSSVHLLYTDFSREYPSYAAVNFGGDVDLSSAIGGVTPWPGVDLRNGDYIFGFPSSIVPIPPSVWLFFSGLLGLIGIARRKA